MPSPKNIVLCLDGTGNQIEENISNVMKLYRAVTKSEAQRVYYSAGVGTIGRKYTWGWLRQSVKNILGLAFGYGLDNNVVQAYEFLVTHYNDGDRIYIFGFSRGAHTARVLAGMIYEIGILRPDQIHLSGTALTAYKQAKIPRTAKDETTPETEWEGTGANFRRVTSARNAAIQFLGLWDSVSSVFIPNPQGFFPPLKLEKTPHIDINPAIKTVRHALAVDERRCLFQPDPWPEGTPFKPNIYAQDAPEDQNVKQLWFAGYHSDVGGGHPRKDSGLSQFSLTWMLSEAKVEGLKFRKNMASYVTGIRPYTPSTTYLYPPADPGAKIHNSMHIGWKLLEFIPQLRRKTDPKHPGLYIPNSHPRYIPNDANIHPSVYERMETTPNYKPANIPPLREEFE